MDTHVWLKACLHAQLNCVNSGRIINAT